MYISEIFVDLQSVLLILNDHMSDFAGLYYSVFKTKPAYKSINQA